MTLEFEYGERLPALIPQKLKTKGKSLFRKLLEGRKRRKFQLQEDWVVEMDASHINPKLVGKLVIPKEHSREPFVVDGASVPLHLFISLISFGMLRPLGVLLTASLVHDFAFEHGVLLFSVEGEAELAAHEIERHEADQLFKEIIEVVNDTPVTAFVAWFAVRLGWLSVKYNKKRFQGKVPYGVLISTGLLIAACLHMI